MPEVKQLMKQCISCPPQTHNDSLILFCEYLWSLSGTQSVETCLQGKLGDQTVESLQILFEIQDTSSKGTFIQELQALIETKNFSSLGLYLKDQPKTIEDKDWEESWKQHWTITPASDNIIICPSWETYISQPKKVVITLDPGGAFGTGTHETTQLMLKKLDALSQTINFNELSVLDIGCGSGILSIAAAKLGCDNITAIDIDPRALEATRKNSVLNEVSNKITVSDALLMELCRTKYDIILANILAPVILELFDEMILRLEPNGLLISSGLIEKSVPLIEAQYEAEDFTDISRMQQDEWFLIQGEGP